MNTGFQVCHILGMHPKAMSASIFSGNRSPTPIALSSYFVRYG